MKTRPRVSLEIHLQALRRNVRKLKDHVSPLKLMGVLKANAYGLGVRPIAETLKEEGTHFFGVAEPKEAYEIHDLGVPILILGSILPEEIPEAVKAGLILPISDLETAKTIDQEAKKQGVFAKGHLLVDTGMGRLGVPVKEANGVLKALMRLENLNFTGIYSHFPTAYADREFSEHQISMLLKIADFAKAHPDSKIEEIHICNSDGIHNVPPAFAPPFTMVRTGINLYGCFDLEGRRTLDLEPVIQMKSRLVAVRELDEGATVGYGRNFVLNRKMTVGTVAMGYADGLPLRFSDQGHLRVRNKKCPIIGRTSMDYTTVDLTGVEDAKVGDEVTCLGEDLVVSDWALAKGTIPYEVICAIGNRVERVVVDKA